ncbi:MAG: hypothetical protein WCT28_04515 [Patescibacteria group bacterium]|jgi:hypothetical protein
MAFKIDSLWVKMLGVFAVLNFGYWILSATVLDFSNVVSGSLFFQIYVAPVILPFAPFVNSFDSHPLFVPMIGALVLFILPIFWSLVAYGIVRAVRAIWMKTKQS